jgi:hypothetical protein
MLTAYSARQCPAVPRLIVRHRLAGQAFNGAVGRSWICAEEMLGSARRPSPYGRDRSLGMTL